MIKTYTRAEVSEMLGINIHNFKALQESGVLAGVKTGREYRYMESDILSFWEEYRGEDLSDPDKIRLAAAMHRQKKRQPARGAR